MSKVGRTDGEAVLWRVCLLVLESTVAKAPRSIGWSRAAASSRQMKNLDAVVME